MSKKNWGQLAVLNIYGCKSDILRNPGKIRKFLPELCKKIKMKPMGLPIVKRFGSGTLEGYSAMQFIETSSITIHMDEVWNRAFVDIFSCRKFNEKAAVAFAKKEFRAEKVTCRNILRG